MSKIYSYAEYLPIAKVGDVVRAVKGKHNECVGLKSDGSNTKDITEIAGNGFFIDECWHDACDDSFLELVSPRIPTWEDLQVGDEIVHSSKEAKILAVLGEVFLRSIKGNYEMANSWMTKKEAQTYGWSLVTPPVESEVQEMTIGDVEKLVGKKVKIVE